MASSIEGNGPDGANDPAVRGDSLSVMNGGLSWTWEFDLDALLEAVKGAAPWLRTTADTEDADADADADAADAERPRMLVPPGADRRRRRGWRGWFSRGRDCATAPGTQRTGLPTAPRTLRTASADGDAVDPEADEAEYQEALAAGRVRDIPLELVAGRIAETLPTGPGPRGLAGACPCCRS